jgi:hypothetical protein
MSLIRRRRWVAGFILGLGPAASSSAQDLPPVFPPSSEPPMAQAGPAQAEPTQAGPMPPPPPLVRPFPPVVQVPPGGVGPVWAPNPIDPVALERRHQPKFVEHKERSWHWRRLQGKLLGYPEEYEPRPLGASLYEHGNIMVARAAAARLVLYRYDFLDGTSELSPRGLDQLAKYTAQLAASPFPLIVERTPADPSLAERRRYAVLAKLATGPCPLPSDRVLVGVPAAHGMSGTDAYIIGNNALTRTLNYGPPIPLLSSGVNSPSGGAPGTGGSGIGP